LKIKITAIFKIKNSRLSTQMGVAGKLSSIKMHLLGGIQGTIEIIGPNIRR
jgi:hypothetical protein